MKTRIAGLLLGLVLLAPHTARAQSSILSAPPPLHSVDLRLEEECDSDLNGALIGAAIGFSPAVLAIFMQDDEAQVALGIGIIGGVVGFVAGLALDSTNCSGKEMNAQSYYPLDDEGARRLRFGVKAPPTRTNTIISLYGLGDAMEAGSTDVNVHTTANKPGETGGQMEER